MNRIVLQVVVLLQCCVAWTEARRRPYGCCCCFASPNLVPSYPVHNDILDLDTRSLSHAIHTKQLSCEELMKVTLEHIDSINPQLNAIILLRDRQELLVQARTADQSTKTPRGWLHGIPTAVKDICNVQGIPTTMGGSRLAKNYIPPFSDPHVKHILQAGAILIGKTNTPEYGLGSHTYNDRWGTTVNPWDVTKSAGGSSGGAAVAVASKMLSFADGTDMMGSLRNPAGWNGIYSHRPTAGLIRGVTGSKTKNPLPYPTSTAGPMARTPLDCAQLLETMAGKDAFDSTPVLTTDLPLKTISIGWLGDWNGQLPMEDGILDLCQKALTRLEDHGAVVHDVTTREIFSMDQLWTSWNTIRFGTVAALFAETFNMDILLGNSSPIKEELKWEISLGLQVSDDELVKAKQTRDLYSQQIEQYFEKYDILALPSSQLFPFPKEWKWPTVVGGVEMDAYHRWMQVCVPVTLGGFPCSTVPAGMGENGLPNGIQLFSRRGEDSKLLQVAQAYYTITDTPDSK